MYIVTVHIFVKPENIQQFVEASEDNSRNTRLEPGNVRFDVLRSETEVGRFLLYEAYHTKEDFAKHQQTEHYLRWKNTVADFMAQPRQGLRYESVVFG